MIKVIEPLQHIISFRQSLPLLTMNLFLPSFFPFFLLSLTIIHYQLLLHHLSSKLAHILIHQLQDSTILLLELSIINPKNLLFQLGQRLLIYYISFYYINNKFRLNLFKRGFGAKALCRAPKPIWSSFPKEPLTLSLLHSLKSLAWWALCS